jgi:putative lipoprotein
MRKLISITLLCLGIPLLAGCSMFSSGAASVNGSVTYQQRTALPADAVLTVRIEDISQADASFEMVGEQVIETKGAQVPIPYHVSYDPDKIEDKHAYGLRAYIKDGGGKFLFTSDPAVLVITNGNPTHNVEVNLIPVSD